MKKGLKATFSTIFMSFDTYADFKFLFSLQTNNQFLTFNMDICKAH